MKDEMFCLLAVFFTLWLGIGLWAIDVGASIKIAESQGVDIVAQSLFLKGTDPSIIYHGGMMMIIIGFIGMFYLANSLRFRNNR